MARWVGHSNDCSFHIRIPKALCCFYLFLLFFCPSGRPILHDVCCCCVFMTEYCNKLYVRIDVWCTYFFFSLLPTLLFCVCARKRCKKKTDYAKWRDHADIGVNCEYWTDYRPLIFNRQRGGHARFDRSTYLQLVLCSGLFFFLQRRSPNAGWWKFRRKWNSMVFIMMHTSCMKRATCTRTYRGCN